MYNLDISISQEVIDPQKFGACSIQELRKRDSFSIYNFSITKTIPKSISNTLSQ